jgi:hypothetical protein
MKVRGVYSDVLVYSFVLINLIRRLIMSLASITGVFPGATVSSGALTIPSGDVISFIPSSATNPGGSEMVFGLLETMQRAVGSTYTYVKSTVNSTTVDATTLRRTYTFTVDLDLNETGLENLNVKS